MTVRQIYTRVEGPLRDSSEEFTAVLYGMVTHANLDIEKTVLGKKCKICNRLMPWSRTLCDTEQCQMALSLNGAQESFEYFFNLNFHLSDQTGTLRESRLTEQIAERILNLTTAEYRVLSEYDVDKLKWSFLMNHFEVKLLIKKPTMLRSKLAVIIIDMRAIDIDELSKYISSF